MWAFAWKFVTPVVLVSISVLSWVNHVPMKYGTHKKSYFVTFYFTTHMCSFLWLERIWACWALGIYSTGQPLLHIWVTQDSGFCVLDHEKYQTFWNKEKYFIVHNNSNVKKHYLDKIAIKVSSKEPTPPTFCHWEFTNC